MTTDTPNFYKIREERHREQLWNAIKDGVVQMVVSGKFFSVTNVDLMSSARIFWFGNQFCNKYCSIVRRNEAR